MYSKGAATKLEERGKRSKGGCSTNLGSFLSSIDIKQKEGNKYNLGEKKK